MKEHAGYTAVGLWFALFVALLANLLDAASTWLGIVHYHARETGAIAWAVVAAWGPVSGLLLVKGTAALLMLGIALTGTPGKPTWWRVRPSQRWVVMAALWVAAAWFSYLAFKNIVGALTLHQLTGW